MRFLIATSNKGKINEFNKIMAKLGAEAVSIYDKYRNFIMPEETGSTFEENARLKADTAYEFTKDCVMADDSGLEVDFLNGAPGIYSARYAGENATDKDNIKKLLEQMYKVEDKYRTARFVCVICCILPCGEKIFSRGECEGKIAKTVSGERGFGYDPIFLTDKGKTFAQLPEDEKNKISHRGIALNKMYLKLRDKFKGNIND